MKKGLLLILGMLMMVSTAEATDGAITNSKTDYSDRNRERSIQFMERGIQFYVFPNGEIDFSSRKKYSTQYYYRKGKRYKKRIPMRGVRIDRDYTGRIKRVGDVFINYNRLGKVSRVGTVFIDYNRRRMTQVGGLHINYDRFGNKRFYGQVKPRFNVQFRTGNFIGTIYDYNDSYFDNRDFYNDYDDYGEDDNYYYYKSKSLKKGDKKGKLIKRKKLKKYDLDNGHKDKKRRS